jgi:biotin-dependent carboxylase-like uncharacterized protein
MDIFTVKNPGPMTTIQDLGRFGFLDRGVPPSGALDQFACRIANLLVGNDEDAAVLEITVMGPILEALGDADIAITGAEMGMSINKSPVPAWKSVHLRKGDVVRIPRAATGCRAYLSVAGGFDVPEVMKSRSTFVRANFGGFQGRALLRGDTLQKGTRAGNPSFPRALPVEFVPEYQKECVLRAIAGPQDDSFADSIDAFFTACYEVAAESDRMGSRLLGPSIVHDAHAPKSIVTEPVTPGNIQIPADGKPIILLVEQTTGGYSKIATVISTDIGKVAQAVPGSSVRFERVDITEARRLCREAEDTLEKIRAHLG